MLQRNIDNSGCKYYIHNDSQFRFFFFFLLLFIYLFFFLFLLSIVFVFPSLLLSLFVVLIMYTIIIFPTFMLNQLCSGILFAIYPQLITGWLQFHQPCYFAATSCISYPHILLVTKKKNNIVFHCLFIYQCQSN